jgi:hypothetical protein
MGLRVITFLGLGMTTAGLVNSWNGLSHDTSLFFLLLTEFETFVNSTPLEDSITGNLLIHTV